ncbi:MAG: metal ABC transporter permease [Bacillota bacterium]
MDILSYDFVGRALAAGISIGLLCPAIGIFLVLRRMSLMGEGLGHAAFAGVATGWALGANPLYSSLAFSVLAALGIERLRAREKNNGDLALAIFLYSSLALGVVLTSAAKGFNIDILSYLIGSILTITSGELWTIMGLGVLVMLTVAVFHKELMALSLDEEAARVSGLPTGFLNNLLMVLTAVTVTLGMRLVGILLVAALMVLPVASALQMASGFRSTLIISMALGVASVVGGLTGAFIWDLAPGGAIVLASTVIYLGVLLIKGIASFFGARNAARCQGQPSFPDRDTDG